MVKARIVKADEEDQNKGTNLGDISTIPLLRPTDESEDNGHSAIKNETRRPLVNINLQNSVKHIRNRLLS